MAHLNGGGAALILYGVLHLSRRNVAYELGEGYRVTGAFKQLFGPSDVFIAAVDLLFLVRRVMLFGHSLNMARAQGKAKGAGISN